MFDPRGLPRAAIKNRNYLPTKERFYPIAQKPSGPPGGFAFVIRYVDFCS